MCVLGWNGSSIGARKVIAWPMGSRGVGEYTILGNRMSRQKRRLFSQGVGDMVLASGTGLICITPVGCCIDRGAEALS